MSELSLLSQYTSYNLWANKRIAGLLLPLDTAILDKEVKSSFTSLRKTVMHIWDAELAWLNRLRGVAFKWPPTAVFSSPAINDFLKTSEAFDTYVKGKDEAYFAAATSYKDSKGNDYTTVNSGIVMHCMNHSTFHRGQIVTMLRETGITQLVSTDLITYLRETT